MILKLILAGALALVIGYGVGLFGGMWLVNTFSSNVQDRELEAAMTGAFVIARSSQNCAGWSLHLRASSASSWCPSDKSSLLLRLSAMVDRSCDTTASHSLSMASGF